MPPPEGICPILELHVFFLLYLLLQCLLPLDLIKHIVSEGEMLKPTIQVLYGSQTGCAQDTAQRIARQAQRKQIQVQLLPLNSYNVVS